MKAISIQNVSKKFLLKHDRPRSLTEGIRSMFTRSKREVFWALKDISLDVEQGEALGVIGHNGAGKSTMLKLLTGIMLPTAGLINTRGRVSALIEVGAGFHPEMTGRENIYLNGSILGMSRAEITKKIDSIVAFAELEKFIDTPVKRYSSGMYARLGFAVAAHVNPDILIVDEVLSVGDAAFQDRCSAHMAELRSTGTTIVFVSHNLSAISALCDCVAVVSRGQLVGIYNPANAITAYREQMVKEAAWHLETQGFRTEKEKSPLVITSVSPSCPGAGVWEARTGDPWEMAVTFKCDKTLGSPEIGFKLFSPTGLELARPTTVDYGVEYDAKIGLNQMTFKIESLPLQPGRYIIEVFAFDRTGAYAFDSQNHVYELTVTPGGTGYKAGARYGAVVFCGDWHKEFSSVSGVHHSSE